MSPDLEKRVKDVFKEVCEKLGWNCRADGWDKLGKDLVYTSGEVKADLGRVVSSSAGGSAPDNVVFKLNRKLKAVDIPVKAVGRSGYIVFTEE